MPYKFTRSHPLQQITQRNKGRERFVAKQRGGCPALASSHIFQVSAAFLHSSYHTFFCATNPLSRIIVTLVWLFWPIRISNLSLQVALTLLIEIQNAFPVGPLCVSVNIYFDNTITDCIV